MNDSNNPAAIAALGIEAKRFRDALRNSDADALRRLKSLGWAREELPGHSQVLNLLAKEQGARHYHQFRQGQSFTARAAEQTLWDRFRPIIATLPQLIAATGSRLAAELHIESDGALEIGYAPFEHVHPAARLIVVGLTPGFTQASAALTAARAALDAKLPDAEVLQRAKETGAFAGAIRGNLIRLLDAIEIKAITGCSAETLFGSERHLIHTTSAVRYPIFLDGQNYNGSVVERPLLRSYVERYLGSELESLRGAVIALGKHAAAAVELLVSSGRLDATRYVGQLPHPSGANAGRVFEALTADPNVSPYAHMVSLARSRVLGISGAQPAAPLRSPVKTSVAPTVTPKVISEIPRPAAKTKTPMTESPFEARLSSVFTAAGFTRTHATSKKAEYTANGAVIYLDRTKLPSDAIQIVLHPDFPVAALPTGPGFEPQPGWFHSTSLRAFPRRLNSGANPVAYGRAVRIDGVVALSRFLGSIAEALRFSRGRSAQHTGRDVRRGQDPARLD